MDSFKKMRYSTALFFSRPWWTGDRKQNVNRYVKLGIKLHKKLYRALLRPKIKYIDVSKCHKGEVAEVGHANKKEKHTITNKLRKGFSSETFNVIVSGNTE